MSVAPHSQQRFRGAVAGLPAGSPRPLWSVMIPTYNCAELLAQTLSSVLASRYPADQMQIEVVDDGSTADDPQQVVQALGKGRVDFYRQPQNLGHARNFNTCLQRSHGHLVHVLHGDDWVSPGFYAQMQALLTAEPDLGAAFCRHVITNDDGSPQRLSPLERATPGPLANWLDTIAAELRLQPPSMVVRRSVYETLGGFDTRMVSCGEDWEMWVRIAVNYPVGYHPEPLAFYRDRSNSLTKRSVRNGQNIRDVRSAARITTSYLPASARGAAARARANWAGWALHWAYLLIERGDYVGAAVQLREAVLCDRTPDTLRKVVRLLRHASRRAWAQARLRRWKRRGVHA